ncbi:enoyl-CoA hydratase-related protein [uncultured Endozoicomonas sp.]|uniref:enoyl-CoA hydratase-related protein n=1 Tax=uncultured Endozoicomonas sp. TaxID=432652 RepID=UPI002616F824|nr:enoyl-CoA hydratase-related protein [uncultured Endozoicomonas sp.]
MTASNNNNLVLDVEPLKNGSGVIATLCLNRPEMGNALNEALIAEFHRALDELDQLPVRLLILKSSGKHFCTGADLNWMRQSKDLSQEDNFKDAQQLAQLIQRLDLFPAPTLALIQGAAYGGALGLITACDMTIATESARFCLSEVKLGLMPAVISPYVVRAMGERQARRYFLSAETINCWQAQQLNIIHERCREDELAATAQAIAEQLLQNAPIAMAEAKQLIRTVSNQTINESLINTNCEKIARVRTSEEGQEGLSAFLEKRTPAWKAGGNS